MIADPSTRSVFAVWTLDPLTTAAVAALVVLCLFGRRRAPGWSPWRLVPLAAGAVLTVVAVDAWPGAYARALLSVLVSQELALLLVCPVLLAFGKPWEPLRALGVRMPGLGPFENPVVGPLVVPIVTGALVFTPLLHLAATSRPWSWVVHLAVLGIGVLCAAPLARSGVGASSLAVGMALFVGLIELLVDAVPGIVLRLETVVLPAADAVARRRSSGQGAWGPSPLHDQQLAGAILWAVAEVVDLPYLLILLRRWVQADRAEATVLDARLDREQRERRLRTPVTLDEGDDDREQPWWERDASVFGDRAVRFRKD